MCLWLARMAVATATVPNACRRWCVKIEIWLVWLTCVLLFSSSSFYYTMNINERTEVNGSRMGKLVLKENKRASKWVIRSEQQKLYNIFCWCCVAPLRVVVVGMHTQASIHCYKPKLNYRFIGLYAVSSSCAFLLVLSLSPSLSHSFIR